MIRAIDESSRAAGQLLDHAMVTFRTDALVEEAVDMAALTREMVERLRPLADLRDIDLTEQVDHQITVKGDPILLQNALRNLLDNAIKYSPGDSVIVVSLHSTEGRARLEVKDRGAGFPEQGAQGLTRRFARGANVAGIVGSGLGLTIADEVVRAHSGNLTMTNNNDGAGACVTMSFPLS